MIEGLGGRLPPIAGRTAAAPVEAPVRIPPTETGTSAPTTARSIAAEPPVDTAKVDRIRNALALGIYRVDPASIAEQMIKTDLDGG